MNIGVSVGIVFKSVERRLDFVGVVLKTRIDGYAPVALCVISARHDLNFAISSELA